MAPKISKPKEDITDFFQSLIPPSSTPPSISSEFQGFLDLNRQRRNDCEDLGYHAIDRLEPEDPQMCYNCELFFGKNQGSIYKIIPHYPQEKS